MKPPSLALCGHDPRRSVSLRGVPVAGWRCGLVSISHDGYECFDPVDKEVVSWLYDQLLEALNAPDGASIGAGCYHLKGRGGITGATQELETLLASGDYPYIIRSDAKGYYAHIRHHKLVGLLKDYGFSREVCRVTTQLCQRMTVRRGIYQECQQGIPLGCSASPALAAIYLSPLDRAMNSLPGVRYLRYMDDWVILCPSRWKMRRAVKLMNQTLSALGLCAHPDKTFIGKTSKGFDFLGVQYPAKSQTTGLSLSAVSKGRLNQHLMDKFSHAARLYEQGRLHSLGAIELYLTHWLRWAKGLGLAATNTLDAITQTLLQICRDTADVMIETFSRAMLAWVKKRQEKTNNENEIITKERVVTGGHVYGGGHRLLRACPAG